MTDREALLEVCVDTIDGIWAAKSGGADRIELCSSLSEGGLTPSPGVMRAAAAVNIPCFAMIRPRAGDFRYSDREIAVMREDIMFAKDFGLAGVVLGAERADGTLDVDSLAQLMDAAIGIETTLHKVIDCVDDLFGALDCAIKLGFDRVLTSGGAPDAVAGASVIKEMITHVSGKLIIMPGGGLRTSTIQMVANLTGATEFHASCKTQMSRSPRHSFDLRTTNVTNAGLVREMKELLAGCR